MRFMIIVKADQASESGAVPNREMLTEMGKYNEELVKAGVLLAAEGLKPSSAGVRVRFDGDKRKVTDGPFSETKELVAGFWLIQVRSKADAIEWVKRCPMPSGVELEIRPVAEMEDFGNEMTPELKAQEERMRAATTGKR